jgi:CDP-diglyceride synthetase
MNKKFQQFVFRLMIISLITAVLYFVLQLAFTSKIISPAIPWLILMFVVITAMVHYILLNITAMNPRKFVGYFMLSTFLKLFVYLVVMVVYVFTKKEGALPFVLAFFILYIIYTIFEVVSILAQTKE